MPQHRLPNPSRRRERLLGLVKAVPLAAALFATLILFNVAQTLSLLLLPLSRQAFRRFNRWAADTWWGWCVLAAEHVMGVRPVLTGDPVPMRESAIVVANHQDMGDITLLMAFARSRGRLGDLKFFVKQPIKYVPGVGWGMVFLDCLFVKRSWAADRESIARTFARLVGDRVPLWLVSFAEGTRVTTAKLARARAYAEDNGLYVPRHVLVPRAKGFAASVQGLRGAVDAVYDVTIGYPDGVPSLWQYIQGFARRAHLHVRRFAIEELPESAEALSGWIRERYAEKDRLLDWFYAHGSFPDAVPLATGPPDSQPDRDASLELAV